MNAPLIGITTYARNEDGHFTLPGQYVDAVRRAGGVPLLLPPGEERIDGWLDAVDGVILAGGGDLDPAHYRGANHESIYMVDAERDRTELDVCRAVLDAGVPTLGICRGTQVLNVVLGGTLHEHLPDVFGEGVLHRAPPREPTPHAIHLEGESRLARILQLREFDAESWHHQAIRTIADALRVTARAPDGVIEAVEKADHPWLVAVQWHPELTAAHDPAQQRLFDALVAGARGGGDT